MNLSNWKREGVTRGARAMLVAWDTFPWPWEPYAVYVLPGEDLGERFAAFDGPNMQQVSAVHLLPTSE